tara:strand:- start:1606 stop:1905 length:300 start_codon:yes stop_codon:yes gene_type:complete
MKTIGAEAVHRLHNPHVWKVKRLTVREKMLRDTSEIVKLIKKGSTTKGIAEHYGIHKVSIQQHIREVVGDSVMLILKANSRDALVAGRKRQLEGKRNAL